MPQNKIRPQVVAPIQLHVAFVLVIFSFIFSDRTQAVDVTYTNRTTFENVLGADIKEDSFEAYAPGPYFTPLITPDFQGSASTTVSNSSFGISTGFLSGGHPTDGNQWIGNGGAVIYEFNKPTRAFGADFVDFGDGYPTNYYLYVTLDDRTPIIAASAPLSDWNYFFFGVISDTPFTKVTTHSTAFAGDLFAVDRMNYTIESVPEPSTWAFAICSGCACILSAKRARRNHRKSGSMMREATDQK